MNGSFTLETTHKYHVMIYAVVPIVPREKELKGRK
jgi:hypothetical protein